MQSLLFIRRERRKRGRFDGKYCIWAWNGVWNHHMHRSRSHCRKIEYEMEEKEMFVTIIAGLTMDSVAKAYAAGVAMSMTAYVAVKNRK